MTVRTAPTRRTAPLAALVVVAVAALSLVGCGKESGSAGMSPAEALAGAKQSFDEASSVHLSLATDAKPDGGNAVLGADGVLTHQPAFEGDVEVMLAGLQAKVPVVAIDGELHAKLPLTSSYAVIDPAEYGAPDPASFADPDTGISALLTELEDVERDGEKRDGNRILSLYTGTVSGERVTTIIPSADAAASYRTTVGIDEDGRVATIETTGTFFGSGEVTYDLAFDRYDEDVEISAP